MNAGRGSTAVGGDPRRRRIPLRVRIVLLVACGLALVVGLVASETWSVTRPVEIQAIAEPGKTTIQLSSHELRPMSPGCGCMDPAWGAHEWFGMSFPSTEFSLHTTFPPSEELDGRRWGLTAISPALQPIDWYEPPDHSLRVRVLVGRAGSRHTLFSGRTTYPLIVTDGKVTVEHGRRYPYAALLPAAGGPVDFDAAPSSRTEFGSSMSIHAAGPERDDADEFFDGGVTEHEYRSRTDFTQRGPMIDVLGPIVRLSVSGADDLELYASFSSIEGFRPGEPVTIEIRTPFAIRLIPHPASKGWTRGLRNAWEKVLRLAREGNAEVRESAKHGPTLQGRYIDTDPQPAYSLHVDEAAVPPPGVWRRFVSRSAKDGMVPAMLDTIDPDGYDTFYQLPPVNRNVEVGVFGPLEKLESSALRGQVFTNGKDVAFGRGQELSLSSDEGLATGRYQMTPLVSAGLPTDQANIAGEADVSIDGRPVNRLPFLPYLLGIVGAVLLGLIVEGFVYWGIRGS